MGKVQLSLKTEDFYRMYRIRCMDKGIKPKTQKQYRAIILAMGDAMTDLLLEQGIVAIPRNIGDVLLKQHRNGSQMIPNISPEGKYLGKQRTFNDHSDGIMYRSFWLSLERRQKKRKGWCFSLNNDTRKKLSKLIFGGKRFPDWQQLNKRTQFRGDKRRYA